METDSAGLRRLGLVEGLARLGFAYPLIGARDEIPRPVRPHKRIARWTLPLWFHVSVTGVIVYWMLYI